MATLKLNNTQSQNVKFNGFDVSVINYNGTQVWEKPKGIDPTQLDYLAIDNPNTYTQSAILSTKIGTSGSVSGSVLDSYTSTYNYRVVDIEYSKDKVNWNTFTYDCRNSTSFSIPAKTKYYFRANLGNTAAVARKDGMPLTSMYVPSITINPSYSCEITGNPMSIIYGDDFYSHDDVPDFGLFGLFRSSNNSSMKISINLPVNKIGYAGCAQMFGFAGNPNDWYRHKIAINIDDNGDSHLTATDLAESAYNGMFSNSNVSFDYNGNGYKTLYIDAKDIPYEAMHEMFYQATSEFYVSCHPSILHKRGCVRMCADNQNHNVSHDIRFDECKYYGESCLYSAFYCTYSTFDGLIDIIKSINPDYIGAYAFESFVYGNEINKMPIFAIRDTAMETDNSLADMVKGLIVREASAIPIIISSEYGKSDQTWMINATPYILPDLPVGNVYICGQFNDVPNNVYEGYPYSLSLWIDYVKAKYPSDSGYTIYCDVYEDECRYYDITPCSYWIGDDGTIKDVYPR